jgi:tetratricopeptide (TPR) repeat protein
MNTIDLDEIERKALNARNEGKLKEALIFFQQIVSNNPNYEFGMCFYHIANCLEDLGDIEQARENYIKAIEFDEQDETRWGGYASFLYLYGTPKEAFDAYLHLFRLEKYYQSNTDKTLIGIKSLGEKLGYSNEKIKELTD